MFTTSVLQEELLGHNLVGVLSSEIDVAQVLLTEQSRACAFSLQINFKVNAIVYDNVQFVLELLHFISIANNVNHLFFVRLKDAMTLNNFPN